MRTNYNIDENNVSRNSQCQINDHQSIQANLSNEPTKVISFNEDCEQNSIPSKNIKKKSLSNKYYSHKNINLNIDQPHTEYDFEKDDKPIDIKVNIHNPYDCKESLSIKASNINNKEDILVFNKGIDNMKRDKVVMVKEKGIEQCFKSI